MHSILISHRVTEWMKEHLKGRFAFFRIGYVLFSIATVIPVLIYLYIATVIPVLIYLYNTQQQILFDWSGFWRLLQVLLAVYALTMFYGGVKVYDLKHFIGISQLRDYFARRQQKDMEFMTSGVLRFVRHPWYSGVIAIVWAFGPVTDVTLVSKIVLTSYLVIGTLLEEHKLVEAIGEPYHHYQHRHLLVPVLWKKKPKGA